MKFTVALDLISQLKATPVLVDVGASGILYPIWQPIAPAAIYGGFDPDLREIREIPDSAFRQAIMINKAVTPHSDETEVKFYLTHSPYCSSTLMPNSPLLAQYRFADFFMVENTIKAAATTLNTALEQINIAQIHWLKLETQGTDLRLFNSLKPSLQNSILALDVEPGLINAYQGEDLFTDLHPELLRQGFWLSRAEILGSVRINTETQKRFKETEANLSRIRSSPGWIETRYLRSLESLQSPLYTTQEYALLWTFSILDQQYGYALDLLADYERRFGRDEISLKMEAETYASLHRLQPNPLAVRLKGLVPPALKRQLKKYL